MTAKCISTSLTESERARIGASQQLRTIYQLRVDAVYVVLGVTFLVRSPILGSTPIFMIADEFGRCLEVPACLFEIVDARLSCHWIARQFENLTLALWPAEFYDEYFHDRLNDYDPAAVKSFREVVDCLEKEANNARTS